MAKLYAEITSDKGGRVVGKGGNSTLLLRIKNGNMHHATIMVHAIKDGGTIISTTTHLENCKAVTHKTKS